MELELEAAAAGGGSRVVSLSGEAPAADLGRGDTEHGGPSRDRTVSRRHVSLRLLDGGGGDPGVAFEVVGRNPVVVRRSSDGGGGSISRVFRRGEKGELRPGDALSLSLKAPSFWAVRGKGGNGEGELEASVLDAVARRERRTRERKERERERMAVEEALEVTKEVETESEAGPEVEDLEIDLATIDPVKEFGFLSMGHEFDSYPKGRIRPPKDWNWFLEEIKRSSDDEEDEVSNSRGRPKGRGGNKKRDGESEDEEWADEIKDEESLSRGPSVKRTKYVTRSKDPKKPRKENLNVKSGNNKDGDEDDEDDEDEEDETLGGFIVNDEDEAMDDMSEEEEVEEFDDEDDDD